MCEKTVELIPNNLFVTPENFGEIQDFIENFSGTKAEAVMIAFMTWNLACKLVKERQ